MPTALLSVHEKVGIVEFAQQLVDLGWNLLASGGTALKLAGAEIPVRDVSELVGGKAILGHRVVTLSRELNAGLLATDSPEDVTELKALGLPRIDLVCVDLYPLKEAINKPGATHDSVIAATDIGGPTMLSAAAKGRRIVICDPVDRQVVIDWLKGGRNNEEELITSMATKADAVVAEYRLLSAAFHSNDFYAGMIGSRHAVCRYGENAWQTPAALYSCDTDDPLALDKFELIEGADSSYNNLCDLDRLVQTMAHTAAAFDVNMEIVPNIAIGCKHGNPCGASFGDDPAAVVSRMIMGDPLAIFGGLVMTNYSIDAAEATAMMTHGISGGRKRILDGVIAPSFSDKAIKILGRKGGKCRLLTNLDLLGLTKDSLDMSPRLRPVRGGFLRQPNYTFVLDLKDERLAWHGCRFEDLSLDDWGNVLLAWAIGSTSNSNTVTLVENSQLIGNGMGQQDRVGCCNLAVTKAARSSHHIESCVAYSDSFFPFEDGPELLAKAGVKTLFASSGSVNDKKIIGLCASRGVNLILIPDEIGRGFFGH